MRSRTRTLFLILVCAGSAAVASVVQQDELVRFSDVTAKAKIDFKHENGSSPDKHLPETMSGGVVLFDFDNDDWLDIFFVNGGSFVDKKRAASAQHRLYRNNQDGTFAEVTAGSGIRVSGFGMGACSADYDNDGFVDLYITGADFSRLYRNWGKGSFVDVTSEAGVSSTLWNASCAFGDIDNDGDVDLYVTRYVDYTPEGNKYCPLRTARAYCHPNEYNGLPHLLFRNNGNGTFTDISLESGILQRPNGNGLGIVFGDYDNDGWIDIYVANDSTPNFLFHNLGKGKFEEVGFRAGVAVGHDGKPQAGMGTDMGDFDGDGSQDIFVTNLIMEAHTLYRNLGKGLFGDVTFPSGVAQETLPFVGFGTAFVDYDNDTDLDLAVANGHVIDNVQFGRDDTTYPQLNLLLQNRAGKFKNVGPGSGTGFAIKKPSRALAVGDLDNDGDMDMVIANVGQAPDVLRNDGGNRSNSLLIRTIGSKSNRDGIGARLKLSVQGTLLRRDVKAGSGYLGQNDLRVHFGLARAPAAERLEILWPSGLSDIVEKIEANQILTVEEGKGVIRRQPFRR
jgi:hypothetical protein